MSSDINSNLFLFRTVPIGLHPYIKIARLDRPIGIWLLLIPGLWAITLAKGGLFQLDDEAARLMFLFAVGAVLMRSAGCIINDLWDQKLDASVSRTQTRPLASGDMNARQALVFLSILLALSLGVLLCLPPLAVLLGLLSLPLIVFYPVMKKITWWPQLFLGCTFNWGALMGWAAVTNKLSLASFLVYAGGILWTLAYDTIYAHQDIKDDALIGIKSTARLFGDKSRSYVSIFYASSLLLLVIAKFMSVVSILTPLLAVPPAFYAIRRLAVWDPKSTTSSHKAFVSSTVYGWLILLLMAL